MKLQFRSEQNHLVFEILSSMGLFALAVINIGLGLFVVAIACFIAAMTMTFISHNTYTFLKLKASLLRKSEVHRTLRENRIWRPLANRLMKAAGVPTVIPTHALFCLYPERDSMSLRAPYSPLDYDVYWCQGESRPDDDWFWRRTDKPIAAVQLPSGRWETQDISY